MKTPMQEMFDQLKASKKDEYGLAFAIDMLLENEQAMLEKERESLKSSAITGVTPLNFLVTMLRFHLIGLHLLLF